MQHEIYVCIVELRTRFGGGEEELLGYVREDLKLINEIGYFFVRGRLEIDPRDPLVFISSMHVYKYTT
jgi:hypothetical protein